MSRVKAQNIEKCGKGEKQVEVEVEVEVKKSINLHGRS